MHFQFTITRLLRSIAFFGVGLWVLRWMASGIYPDMQVSGVFMSSGAFGGAIGALFGKTPHGVFWGLMLPIGLAVALIVIALVYELVAVLHSYAVS